MLKIKLTEIIAKGDEAIAAASTFLGQKMAILDCTGVEAIATEQLKLLFAKIPATWDFVELGEAIDTSTLNTVRLSPKADKLERIT